MVLGMPPLVVIHVLISLLGIGSGIAVLLGFLGNQRLDGWTHFFLLTPSSLALPDFFFLLINCSRRTSSEFSR